MKGGGGIKLHPSPSEKTTLKKSRLIRVKSEYSKYLICSFFFTCYTAKTTLSFSNFFYWKHYEIIGKNQHWLNYLIYLLLSEKGYWTSVKYHTFPIDSLVFSMVFKICKNLQFHAKNKFWPNNLVLQNAQLCLSKKTNWILTGNSYVGIPPIIKAFGIRMVNY